MLPPTGISNWLAPLAASTIVTPSCRRTSRRRPSASQTGHTQKSPRAASPGTRVNVRLAIVYTATVATAPDEAAPTIRSPCGDQDEGMKISPRPNGGSAAGKALGGVCASRTCHAEYPNARRVPDGAQTGNPGMFALWVNGVSLLPSGRMVHTSYAPDRSV